MTLHKSIRAAIASLVGVTVKLPAAYDIAGSYETVADWSQVYPKPKIVFHKATEGNFYQDPKFKSDFAGMAANGIKRAAYHFHRKAISPTAQAQYFCNYISGTITQADKLILDIEEGGETPTQIIQWLNEVENTFPNEIIIYSRKNLLDPIVAQCTESQLTRLQKYRLWIAGYPLYPDNYSTIPSGYVPANLGSVIAWQYSENGNVSGISGEVDLDWLAPSFAAELGTPAPSDVTTTPHDGMVLKSGVLNGWDYRLFKMDPRKFRFEVVYCNPPETVSSVVKRKGATAGWNTGDYDRFTYQIQDWLVSNGVEIVTRDKIAGRPSFQVQKDTGAVAISAQNLANVAQAFTGIRPLVELGAVAIKLFDDTQAQNTEGHARFVFALDINGNVILFSSRGAYPNQGLKLREAASIVQQNGAISAADGGGGGDVTCVLDGQSLILPENEENGVHFERLLPAVLLAYAKESTNMQYKVIWSSGVAKRLGPTTSSNSTGAVLPVNTIVDVLQDNIPDATYPTDPTKLWCKFTDGTYGASIYGAGSVRMQLVSTPPPPATVTIESLTIEPAPGTVFTWLKSDGTVTKETV